MICNSKATIYHKGFNEATKLETWTRYNYDNVWFFGGKGARFNKGLSDANDVDVRLPYDANENLNIINFALDDIIVQGELDFDIQTQQDLSDYLIYNINSISNNNFGINPHIRIGGK